MGVQNNPDRKTNIVIINPDQMRADALHHLGNLASSTPAMDALAAEGVSFENCFCQNPVCVPSRCSFMTGLYPHVHGHRTMGHLLRKGESNLFSELKAAGYFVWSNGRGDLIAGQDREWLSENYDVLYDEPGIENGSDEGRGNKESDNYFSFYRGAVTSEHGNTLMDSDMVWAHGAVNQIKNMPEDKPFLLFLGLNAPHPPYRVEQKFINRINTSKLPPRIPSLSGNENKPSMEEGLLKGLGVSAWDEERFNRLRTVYLGMCARVDDIVEMVVNALKEQGVYDDTAIFIFSDHGDYTGDYGLVEKSQNTFEDCLTNVPLIIKPPKGEPVDTGINKNLVEMIDFYATVVDYAQVEPKRDHFGISLRGTIKEKTKPVRDAVFCEGGRRHAEQQCMEKGNSAMGNLMDDYDPRMRMQQSEGPEHTKAAMVRTGEYKYVKRLYESDELYDLKEDPDERVNRIGDARYVDTIAQLKDRLLIWYQETCDVVPRDEDSRFSERYLIRLMSSHGGIPAAYLEEQVFEKKRPLNDVIAELMQHRQKP